MLTKEERAAIAERLRECDYLYDNALYQVFFGHNVPGDTTFEDDSKAILERLIDLCDTSNMIEIPRDKDGVPFKRGDTVYESDGTEHKVDGYAFANDDAKILSMISSNNKSYVAIYSDKLTHKKPVTIKSLAKELTDIVAADYGTPMVVKRKLEKIADQLESLGDSDD